MESSMTTDFIFAVFGPPTTHPDCNAIKDWLRIENWSEKAEIDNTILHCISHGILRSIYLHFPLNVTWLIVTIANQVVCTWTLVRESLESLGVDHSCSHDFPWLAKGREFQIRSPHSGYYLIIILLENVEQNINLGQIYLDLQRKSASLIFSEISLRWGESVSALIILTLSKCLFERVRSNVPAP